MKIMARRGVSSIYPENTMASFQAAADCGADGIHFDVHMTKDGQLVVIQDEHVNRTTDGTGLVANYTAAGIRQLHAGRSINSTFSGEKIPFLEEVLEWAEEERMSLSIELKNNVIGYTMMENTLLQALYRFGLEDRVILSSLNLKSMLKIRRLDPFIGTALLCTGRPSNAVQTMNKIKAHEIHCETTFLFSSGGRQAAEQHIPLAVTISNDTGNREILRNLGVDTIMTDCPHKWLALTF
jgi:glycerophosphoryl diester phosphodiesterase